MKEFVFESTRLKSGTPFNVLRSLSALSVSFAKNHQLVEKASEWTELQVVGGSCRGGGDVGYGGGGKGEVGGGGGEVVKGGAR